MFTTLLESAGPTRTKQDRWLTASTGMHLAAIAAAVTLTPQREVRRAEPPEEVRTVYIDDSRRPALPHSSPAGGRGLSGTPQLPTTSNWPDIVGVSVPDVDLNAGQSSLGNDFASGDSRCRDTSVCIAIPTYGGAPMSVGQVDKPAIQLPGNPRPVYPEMLRTAGIEGSVVMRFIIDTTGVVEPASIIVAHTDHQLFAGAVKSVLLKNRFLPAEAAGRKVRMLVEQRFDFAIDR